MRFRVLVTTVALAALSVGAVSAPAGLALSADPAQGNYAPYVDKASYATAYRRLTESQYRNAIADTFGAAIKVGARFEPERREEGLQAVGNARLSITPSGLEQYYAAARSVADQVIDGKDRDVLVGCGTKVDSACAERFIKWRGQDLFRRPLTAVEIAHFKAINNDSFKASNDANKALKQTMVALLMSPEFLFRIEKAEADPANAGAMRLDAYTKASRLSYLLWNAAPDAELLEAARTGAIHTQAGLEKQADRLLASKRLQDGARAFFSDMLEFEAFDTLSKDGTAYPKFSQAVADSAREETLRFLADHTVVKKRDYRDIFTSRDTFIDRNLAYVYNVPFLSAEKWAPYTFAADSERSGVLTQVTFMSLFAHPAASSPTIRGVKLNEIFLCVQIPPPPADVDFSKVQALEKGTVRVRLLDHMTNPGCIGCHSISDPVGLALERFDGLGQRRDTENGAPIDVSAKIGNKTFSGAVGAGQYLHDEARAATCLVRKVNYYGVGRLNDAADAAFLTRQNAAFAASGYKLPALFRSLVTDSYFYKVVPPAGAKAPVRTASLNKAGQSIPGDVK